MKTNVSQTSIEAYYSLPDLGRREHETLRGIYENPDLTDRELAAALGMTNPNGTGPRRNKLEDEGLVVCSGRRRQANGKTCLTWRVTEQGKRRLFCNGRSPK